MSTNVQAVIDAAADEADGLLEGIVNAEAARPVLLEWLGDNHPEFAQQEREAIVAKVLQLLVHEGFFELAAGTDEEPDEERYRPDD